MKPLAKLLSCAALSLCVLGGAVLSVPVKVSAAERTSVVALGGDGAENFKRLTAALREAKDSGSLTVKIQSPGTYPVSSTGRALMMRSNTILDLNGSTLVRSGTMYNFVQNEDLNGSRGGGGYGQTVNFGIRNGTLDGSGGSQTPVNLVNLGHASDILLENVTFKNCRGGHLVELSGCQNATISDCVFSGYDGSLTGDNEAIQLDICDNTVAGSWNGVYYSDGTVCRSVTVDGCRFLDYPAGVGNHHTVAGNHCYDINITNNTFENKLETAQSAIWCYGFENSLVSGNTITGNYSRGIMVSAGSVTVKNNTVKNARDHALYITCANSYTAGYYCVNTIEYSNGCEVRNNRLASVDGDAVCIFSGSNVRDFSNNTVSSKHGAAVAVSGYATDAGAIKSNSVTAPSGHGIRVAGDSRAGEISGNTVNCGDNGIQVSSDASAELIDFNVIHSAQKAGIAVAAKVDKIFGNTVRDCGTQGIYVAVGGEVKQLALNAASGCGAQGLRVNNPDIRVILARNSSSGNGSKDRFACKTSKGKADTSRMPTPIIKSAEGGNNGIKFSWYALDGAERYRVFYKTGSGENWKRLGDTGDSYILHKNAEPGRTYIYTVRCMTPDGSSHTGGYDHDGIAATLRDTPEISSSASVYGGMKLKWSAVDGADAYRVFYKETNGDWKRVGTSDSNEFVDSSIKSGTGRTYTVRAIENGSYCSGYNVYGYRAFFIAAPVVKSVHAGLGGITLSWDKVPGAAKYRVFFKNSDGKWTRAGDAVRCEFTDKTAAYGTPRTYTVRCLDSAGNYCSAYNTDGRQGLKLHTPEITASKSTPDGVTISWNAVEGAHRYRVFRRNSAGKWVRAGDSVDNSFTDPDVAVGSTYIYTVRCTSPDGGSYESGYLANGFIATYSVKPHIDGALSTDNGVLLSWNEVKGAAKYRVFYKNSKGGWTRAGDVDKPEFLDRIVINGKSYTYTVRCLDLYGNYISGYEKAGFTYKFKLN